MTTTIKSRTPLIIFSLMFFGILGFGKIIFAAEYYVSSTGNATWNQCANISTPCDTATAFANAEAGDTVNFRGGTYNVPQKNFYDPYSAYYAPVHSGTSEAHIIFKAYADEAPNFSGTAGGTGDAFEYATVIGVYQKAYIEFDGFTVSAKANKWGRVVIAGDHSGGYLETDEFLTHHIWIKNMTFIGGDSAITNDNREGLRIEDTNYVYVQNNVFHGYGSSIESNNHSAIRLYHDRDTTIENNEIYDCWYGINNKSDTYDMTFRNNYVHDNGGFGFFSESGGYKSYRGKVYNNLLINNDWGAMKLEGVAASGNYGPMIDWQVYNNTCYNVLNPSQAMIYLDYSDGITVYNNISVGVGSAYGNLKVRYPANIDIIDYNIFHGDSFENQYVNSFTSLSAWQTANIIGYNPDAHSYYTDPMFTNASGLFSAISDFTLVLGSPAIGTGLLGSDMGANIDLVGIQGESDVDTIAPGSPSGLSVL